MILETIKKHLKLNIKVQFIEIYNESMLHNHSKKNLTHLKMIIVSDNFINHSLISRHRIIFTILKENIKEKIYSITLYTYTLTEWKFKKNKTIDFSLCLKKMPS